MAKRRVVLTGASGYVAQRMFAELSERWEIVPLDVRPTTRDGKKVPGLIVTDLTRPNRDEYRAHFRGADAVIHCGFVSAPGLDANTWQDNSDAKFWAEHTNVALCYNVCRVALEEGVRRVVVCSSNHAADYYERLVWEGRLDMVTPEMPARSDNWYGWAKAAYELLGFVFATGKVDGRRLEIVQWRIGGPRDDDIDHVKPGDLKVMHRALGAYLSRRDQVQQAVRMVETEDIRDARGVPFQIVYGISGNTHRFWSIANAREVIGYEPTDDSQVNFADKIAAIARAARKDRA
jgi:NAD dependent epimerase/dehydratase family